MRILVVTNLYPPHHLGGYELACAGTVAGWRDAGHEVEVLTSTWHRSGVAPDEPSPSGERVERTLPISWDNHALISPPLRRRLAMERTTRRVIRATARRYRPDVVSIWNAAALSFGQFGYWDDEGIPLAFVVMDDWLVSGPDLDPWTRMFTGRGIARKLAATVVRRGTGLATTVTSIGRDPVVCFVSEHLRRRGRAGRRWDLGATPVIPLGIDHGTFPVRTTARETGWRGRLLFVGRIDPRKGVHTVLRAVAQLDGDVHLEVVGSGDPATEAEVFELADMLGVTSRVTFHGHQPTSFVREAHQRADALIFSSEWDEPFGMVPVEAMASGLPVIGTGTGGSGEFLIDGVTCVRYAPGDPGQLAAAVRQLARDSELRDRLHRAGPSVAAWLSWDAFRRETLAWHEFAAGGGEARLPAERPVLPLELAGHAPPPVDVRVGIVNWNGGPHLARCLDALPQALGGLRAEIVVVDNASTDDSISGLDDNDSVALIENEANVGYARAMNQALAGSTAPTLIALNPDSVPPAGSLRTLVERLHADPDVGLVAPQLVGSDGQPQDSVWRFPSIRLGVVANLIPRRLLPEAVRDRFWLEGTGSAGKRADIDWAIGAVHVVRAAAVATRPPYRERWFIYVEDVDLCWRLRNAGWRVRLEGDVEVIHVGNVSGAHAFGTGQMARYLRETYDWCALVRGRTFARIYALMSLIGSLLWLVGGSLHRPVRGRLSDAQRATVHRAMRIHARTVLRGPAAPAPPPHVGDVDHATMAR